MTERRRRHVLGISGGKDSAALAVYLRDRVPEMEYYFCDTQKELPETYDYLNALEAYLGKPIARLNAERGFDHWLKVYGGYLPSTKMRWCTRQLKIRPFEAWLGDDDVYSYIGIRWDEDREGYISSKPNITPVYPFREDNIVLADVHRILEEAGVGLPKYYEWRTRSGCYFCFFQRKAEWLGLKDHHPELFEAAKEYEKMVPQDGQGTFTWSERESLEELERPDRAEEVRARLAESVEREQSRRRDWRLVDVLGDVLDDEDEQEPCLACAL